ncbi:xenotropic and polytropic retrovirus receptor 1 homolog [Drosophila novamexicana]|uniref:xenotropic and polytropic retrovirus receptor 1 homolog n=1 Tax=Drosophila novamexicana TaxID=47314 RepID=UPI0011E5CAA8|nr:xenotropic and polytropic retrovirus receptor 1 homolog [Drosophila novamexicana]
MKFGKTFESHLTTEWRQQYMNYAELNAMIRKAVVNAPDVSVSRDSRYIRERDKTSNPEVLAYYQNFERNFFATCHQELSRVEDFFAHKLAEARRKLEEIRKQLISMQNNQRGPGTRQLGLACSEFYLSLIMLQNFQSLNYTAFRKICKKYDKYIKSNRGAMWFHEYVSEAPFTNENELRQMISEVEQLYTTYLTNGDRARAMAKLRVPPLRQFSSPARVFIAGMLLGLFIVSAIIVIISFIFLNNQAELVTAFSQMYRGQFFWVLSSFYLAINVYVWQNVGINHVLIFDVDLRNQISPASFLEVASGLGYLCTISMLLFLHHNEFDVVVPYHFPLISLVVPFLLLINPIRIFNYPARMWLIRCIGRVVSAPFFHVTFAEFWLADQLNSLVLCFVDNYQLSRFYVRYYANSANAFDFEHDFMVPIIRCLPPWFRLAQCLRRYKDSTRKHITYLLNAAKYATNIIVVICSTVVMETNAHYGSVFENPWIWVYLAASLVSTVYSTTWDLIKDFGLFRVWRGENRFLREHLIYRKWFYYFAIVVNVTIRFAWVLELYLIAYNILKPYNCKTIVSLCELTRRFIWNFLRLENEHLFNCGNFRATRDIFLKPLGTERSQPSEKTDNRSRGVQVNLPKKTH